MTKRVQWHIYNGEILEADYINNLQEPENSEDQDDQDDQDDLSPYLGNSNPAVPVKQFDPDQVITYTGDVLYVGQEDAVVHDYVLRQIKFIVKDHSGLVWSLLPAQIRYL